MTEDLIVDPTISKLIQLIEQHYDSILECKGIIDGVGTDVTYIIEQLNGSIIETQCKFGSNDCISFESKSR